jgi:ferredoxin
MRIKIDRQNCQGNARCAAIAGGLYVLDEGGYIASDGFEVPAGMEDQARRGARACPERAITVIEDERR